MPSENRRPLFPSSETGQRTIPENTRAGRNIGAPVAAEDPENDRLTYTLNGADMDSFTIVASTGQIRTKDALDFETKSSYSVTVEVHDGKDGTGATSTTIDDTQNVTITVGNLEEQGTVTLNSETATIQARVPVTAMLEDDDGPIDATVTWQWARSRSSTSGWANISGATSDTFEPQDTDIGGYIRATASYNDGEGTGKTAQAVSPRVGQAPPVNSAPAFPATEDGRREIAEDAAGGTAVGDPVAATDFNNDTLTYTLSGTDAALFTIGANDGQLRVATGATLDFETKRTLRVTVEVTDGLDSLGDPDSDAIDDRQNVTVTLTDVNEAPEVTGDGSPSVAENLNRAIATYTATDPERDTLTWSVDSQDFWISQEGQLHFAEPPSYEDGPNYSVTITAEDEEGLSGSLVVSVTVTDLEEAGVVTTQPLRGWDGTSFQAELQDDDNVDVGTVQWQWQRSSNRSNWGDISGATSNSYTAGTDDIDQYLQAVATYEDDRGSGKEASAALTERIADSTTRIATNNAPEFTEDDDDTDLVRTTTRSISAGTAPGRNIGSPVRATDPDNGDILTYSLGGSDAGLFDIDTGTGQLKTRAVLEYDPEGANAYEVQVRVHDGFDSLYDRSTSVDATITVTITVTEAPQPRQPSPQPTTPADPQPTTDPEPQVTTGGGGGGFVGGTGGIGGVPPAPSAPRFTAGARTTLTVAADAQPGDAVGNPLVATRPGATGITYSLSGAGATHFTVDQGTGQVRVGPDADLLPGQSYALTLTATDNQGRTGSIVVTIMVPMRTAGYYDLNGDGEIQKAEILRAVSDYFAGFTSKREVLSLISLYFAG